jgi:hypothetical protein
MSYILAIHNHLGAQVRFAADGDLPASGKFKFPFR